MATEYNANSIRILTQEERSDKFEWVKTAELAKQYNRDEDWIKRGFEACRRAGLVNADYFINRYLAGDKTIPRQPLVESAFADILKE